MFISSISISIPSSRITEQIQTHLLLTKRQSYKKTDFDMPLSLLVSPLTILRLYCVGKVNLNTKVTLICRNCPNSATSKPHMDQIFRACFILWLSLSGTALFTAVSILMPCTFQSLNRNLYEKMSLLFNIQWIILRTLCELCFWRSILRNSCSTSLQSRRSEVLNIFYKVPWASGSKLFTRSNPWPVSA